MIQVEADYLFGFCTETQRAWRARSKMARGHLEREWATDLVPDPENPEDPSAFMQASWPDGMVKTIMDVTVANMEARKAVLAAVQPVCKGGAQNKKKIKLQNHTNGKVVVRRPQTRRKRHANEDHSGKNFWW